MVKGWYRGDEAGATTGILRYAQNDFKGLAAYVLGLVANVLKFGGICGKQQRIPFGNEK